MACLLGRPTLSCPSAPSGGTGIGASADGADTFRLIEDLTATVLDAGEPVVTAGLGGAGFNPPRLIRLLGLRGFLRLARR